MENLPVYISILFVIITIATAWWFYKASDSNKKMLLLIVCWLIIQGVLAQTGFYTITDTMPPRFLLTLGPLLVFIIVLFTTHKGKEQVNRFDAGKLTLIHLVRIPVELTLLLLFLNGAIPGIMTFEGQNFDILSGITAPLIYYFVFVKKNAGSGILLAWNIICLVLLVNIVAIAILAAPFNFQQIAFDQPNRAILYFPFIWLPSFVVPVVLFAHLAVILKWKKQGQLKMQNQ